MRIEAVDLFYVAMPEVTDAGDGSQDALLVRVAAGGLTGWGECEASPLPSIAAFVCPKSHGACKPIADSVLGQSVETPADIARIAHTIAWDSMDLLQAPHTWSGIEMALWDLVGKARGEPVWRLLGYDRAHPKTPYASQLWGDTPQETRDACQAQIAAGFRAVKCGWGPFGRGTLQDDVDQLHAAREGLGPDGILLVDAGAIFGEDVEAAAARLPALEAVNATWYEEPVAGMAYEAYAAIGARSSKVRLAGGEAAHNLFMARHTIDYGKVGYVQIDCGRIGGIGPAKAVAEHAVARGITYVNHTFTSNLALSASLQPFAGLEDHRICEFPVHTRPVAKAFCATRIEPDARGLIHVPDAPGLGVAIDPKGIRDYLLDVEIRVGGRTLYSTPSPD
jgi:L-alanine-DL-glutamate epimerase-like enolase superfamily enzyme